MRLAYYLDSFRTGGRAEPAGYIELPGEWRTFRTDDAMELIDLSVRRNVWGLTPAPEKKKGKGKA